MNHHAAIPMPARADKEEAGAHPLLRPGERRAPLWQLFRPGQLLELSGGGPGKLSTAARLVARAQAEGEPVAWVAARGGAGFYPPDFARAGVDLARLVVVRVPPEQGSRALVRASEVLLRSGAFGLVVIDFVAASSSGGSRAEGRAPTLGSRAEGRASTLGFGPEGRASTLGSRAESRASTPRGELAWQARLAGLARMHLARVVLLTGSPREQPSLGPLISLRVEPRVRCEGARVVLAAEVLKCKLGAETALSPDIRTLPAGACT